MRVCIGMGGMKVCVIAKLSVSESKQEFYIGTQGSSLAPKST